MKDCNLLRLCFDKEWPEVRKYLSSDAAEEEKKSNIMYCNDDGWTCLLLACYQDTPDDIVGAMLDIGGKELVMKIIDVDNGTILHDSCDRSASYDIIKMLIIVGGKDLIMAKDKKGDTALHHLCLCIEEHNDADEKIKLILQVGDANLLLSTKNFEGRTPLEIATENCASNLIKELLTLQSTTNSARCNNNPSTNTVPADNGSNSNPIIQSNQEQDTTGSATVAGIQMIKQEKGEPSHTQKLLEEYNRRAADLEATVETQRLDIADLSSEKDDIEKKCMDKVDKLTRKLSKQQAELQLLKKSSSGVEVGMKRKHTNKEHEEGEGTAVVQSQTQSSKRRRVGNAANILSVALNTQNQADDDDDDLVNILMSRHMALRKELRSAKAQIVELKNMK
eukprot:scaffold416_cov199-Chaetoceros_neogracile.AAC.1